VRLTKPDTFVFRAVADAHHLVWMTGPVEEEATPTALLQHDLRTKRTTTLVRGIDTNYGLASTARWVVYARTDSSTRLLATRHDGSHTVELSGSIVAPIATRGELVAWAERHGASERVIVRDMANGKQWLAVSEPQCRGGRCRRVDSVTLADRGVVFTRTASDPDESFIVRRGFADRRASRVRIPRDPQPELLPSSAGALYHALGRGWFRWDFGRARPRRTAFAAEPPVPLLGYERGYWFRMTNRGCRYGVVAQHDRGVRTTIASPSRLMAAAGTSDHEGLCVQLGGLTWTGRQPITSWGVIPEESEEEHEEHGLVGLIDIGPPLHDQVSRR